MKKWVMLGCFLLAALLGYRLASPKPSIPTKLSLHLDPDREAPLLEAKPFAFVIHAYQAAPWCEKMLRTIFEQEYEPFRILFFDDGSQDGTFEKVQAFVIENHQEERVILIRNPEPLGPVACLYRAVDALLPEEIVIPIEAKDWLMHPKVLQRLNRAYQNQDVWMTAASPMLYPSYALSQDSLSKSGPMPASAFLSFYAGLFQKVRLSDLLSEGCFVKARDAYLDPMLQMASGRVRIFQEPLFMENCAKCIREVCSKPISSYAALQSLSPHSFENQATDIVLFSFDRPMQLYACLESIYRYMGDHGQISVICRASSPPFRACYQKVIEAFPQVRFLFQSSKPTKDFKPLLLDAVFHCSSRFILFGVDDQIVTDYVDLKQCMEMMDRTGAYGFYLRLGSHITYSFQLSKEQTVPKSINLGQGIFAWNLTSGYTDWEFPNNVDMTLYRKEDIADLLKNMRYKNPNSFEFGWAKKGIQGMKTGLYFAHSKVVNIPLNVMSVTNNPYMKGFPVEELLATFEKGWKIDIDPLYRIDNLSPHIEYHPQFIFRECGSLDGG